MRLIIEAAHGPSLKPLLASVFAKVTPHVEFCNVEAGENRTPQFRAMSANAELPVLVMVDPLAKPKDIKEPPKAFTSPSLMSRELLATAEASLCRALLGGDNQASVADWLDFDENVLAPALVRSARRGELDTAASAALSQLRARWPRDAQYITGASPTLADVHILCTLLPLPFLEESGEASPTTASASGDRLGGAVSAWLDGFRKRHSEELYAALSACGMSYDAGTGTVEVAKAPFPRAAPLSIASATSDATAAVSAMCHALCRAPPPHTIDFADPKPYYVTTPIYYPNAAPHIGTLFTSLLADVLARWQRVKGRTVFYMTGTDEHGQKVKEAAEARGLTPKQHVDDMSGAFVSVFKQMGIGYDRFIRTTDDDHMKRAQQMWSDLEAAGLIYWGKHEGWYSVSDENWVVESSVQDAPAGADGKVPTNSDGTSVKIDVTTGKVVEWHKEENWMFKLSAMTEPLLEFYAANPTWVTPSYRLKEQIEFIKGGLRDISVSRLESVNYWAVPIPGDSRGHRMYVWLDALTNYLTAAETRGDGCWPPNVQVLGKDIAKFHLIYWPAFLIACKLPLPKTMLVHGWWMLGDAKISKSTGGKFYLPEGICEEAFRYYLMRDSAHGDANFREAAVYERYSTELANKLGNTVCRALAKPLVGGVVATFDESVLNDDDNDVIFALKSLPAVVDHAFSVALLPQRAITAVMAALDEVGRFINTNEPWKKDIDPVRKGTVMYIVQEAVRLAATALLPIMPDKCTEVLDALSVPADARSGASALQWGVLKAGTPVGEAPILFPRVAPPAAAPAPDASAKAAAANKAKENKAKQAAAQAAAQAAKAGDAAVDGEGEGEGDARKSKAAKLEEKRARRAAQLAARDTGADGAADATSPVDPTATAQSPQNATDSVISSVATPLPLGTHALPTSFLQ